MPHSFRCECQVDKQLAFFIFNFSEWNSRLFSLRPLGIYEPFFFSLAFREESTCTRKTLRYLPFYGVNPLAGIKQETQILVVLRNCRTGHMYLKNIDQTFYSSSLNIVSSVSYIKLKLQNYSHVSRFFENFHQLSCTSSGISMHYCHFLITLNILKECQVQNPL